QLVREAYGRMSQEVNASHILIRVAPDASPADTLAAYQKVVALRQRVAGGEDFTTLARTVSEDPSAKENGGKLGYFTAMQMVYPFENAAYSTAPPPGPGRNQGSAPHGAHHAAGPQSRLGHRPQKNKRALRPPAQGRGLEQARGPVFGRPRLGPEWRRIATLWHRPHDSLLRGNRLQAAKAR
nr:hypothetical protein [Tanacetum cinerariifolium]